ncbi:MAG: PTS sugar transporter subunit IIC [Eubacteriales bacterium]|jgi:sucrose PTS system EIIBCA or EIIBC component
MDCKKVAQDILQAVGGEKNVSSADCCATRLRIGIRDMARADKKRVKAIEGVLGTVEADGEIQVVLGPGNVNKVSEAFRGMLKDGSGEETAQDRAKKVKARINEKNNTPFKNFLKGLSNVFVPLIPAFIGCGMLYGISKVIGNIPGIDENMITILKLIGKSIFTYMEIMVGMNVAKILGGSPSIGGAIAGLLMCPGLSKVIIGGAPLVPDCGGIFAVLMASACGALLEKQLHKWMPSVIDLIVTPTLVLLIIGFASLYIVYPIGTFLTNALAVGITSLVNKGGAVVGAVLSGTFLPLVMTGLHRAITPIETSLLKSTGIDLIRPILGMAGAGQVGAGLAVYFKTKSKKLKHILVGSIPIGMMGVAEPLMYGVILPLGKPFITACIGAMFGGAFVAATHVATLGIGLSGIPMLLILDKGGHLNYIIGTLLAYVAAFLLTYFTKWNDMSDDEEISEDGGNDILAETLHLNK